MVVAVYLAAITAANLIVAQLGPSSVVWVAFLFIGLDLTLRDTLHERWAGDRLALRMGLLIAAGGLLSYGLNRDAGPIAGASSVDGTFLRYGPDQNEVRLRRWLERLERQPVMPWEVS